MTVERGVVSYAVAVLGILLILAAVVITLSLLEGDVPVKSIISKSIDLRNATDPVKKAKLVTSLDKLIEESKNEELNNQWDRMTECLATRCPDEAYLDLTLITLAEYPAEIPESDLLVNVVAVNKYWNDQEHLLEFSKALSVATDEAGELKSKNARKIWDQIVACNGVCSQKNDLFFEFIRAVVQ